VTADPADPVPFRREEVLNTITLPAALDDLAGALTAACTEPGLVARVSRTTAGALDVVRPATGSRQVLLRGEEQFIRDSGFRTLHIAAPHGFRNRKEWKHLCTGFVTSYPSLGDEPTRKLCPPCEKRALTRNAQESAGATT
jgi:hypothetical protein